MLYQGSCGRIQRRLHLLECVINSTILAINKILIYIVDCHYSRFGQRSLSQIRSLAASSWSIGRGVLAGYSRDWYTQGPIYHDNHGRFFSPLTAVSEYRTLCSGTMTFIVSDTSSSFFSLSLFTSSFHPEWHSTARLRRVALSCRLQLKGSLHPCSPWQENSSSLSSLVVPLDGRLI